MADNKRYFWIKLKTNFFNRDEIDFMLSQKNGCEYVVLYQMLCLNTANTDGKLQHQIGEMIIPYNAEKIVRDCKYFDIDTVNVAMSLYKQLGLIYEEEDGALKISNFDEMVGSETNSASRIREWRKKKKNEMLQCNTNVTYIETQENRDKSIEYRDKNIDIDKEKDNSIIQTTTTNIYEYVEKEYGRTLSSTEIQKIQDWSSLFNEEIIKYAIEISILNNKKFFGYVAGILRSWKDRGFKTIQDIKDNEVQRYQERKPVELSDEVKELLDYDWLNDPEFSSDD